MTFAYPLGLLGLIGIPILIILYIIKSHYTEQTVASVYLWQLSEKFLKKKKRVRFSGLLSLILQIIAVAAISLTIAGPKFILKDAANDYCFVLDASGSMSGKTGEVTRFEAGKEEIRKIVRQSKDGSTYSLIYAGSTTFEVCTDVDSKDTMLSILDVLDCEWGSTASVDALLIAQQHYTANHSPITYLVTDKAYTTENIQLINVAQAEENYALSGCTYRKVSRMIGGVASQMIEVTGKVMSCDRDADITLELYLNGTKYAETVVTVQKQVAADFLLDVAATDFDSITLKITNPDALMADNEVTLYTTGQTQNNRTLLVSDAGTYLESALRASGKTEVQTVSTADYNENPDAYAGFGLYIFDTGAEPSEVPGNAAVWFFNVRTSVRGSGFSFQMPVKAEGMITASDGSDTEIENRFEPEYTASSSSAVKKYLKNMLRQDIVVKEYARYVTSGGNFTHLLYQQNDNRKDSLLFVGTNENGARQAVFAFDLHDTDLPLKIDYLLLINNLLDYSFPTVVEQTQFEVGQTLTVNVPAGCSDLLLEAPSGKISYPDYGSSVAECTLDQVGTYKVTAIVGNNKQTYYVYTQLPQSESEAGTEETFTIEKQSESTVADGYYDKLIIYFIILALAFMVDWGVYCYEQYQLR